MPVEILELVRNMERANAKNDDFYIDIEFATLPRRQCDKIAERIPVEIAVRRLDGESVIDSPIKYCQSIPEILGTVPRIGRSANFT